MADGYDLATKKISELDAISAPLVSGTDSIIITRGGKPFTIGLDDFIDFIS
jgi:hypothetical protein